MTDRMPDEESFGNLLGYLKQTRGFDFTGYKRPSLMRRIEKRMASIGVGSFGDYQDYLEVHPSEFAQLFNTILINVTSFFRDAPAWDLIRSDIVPRIVARKRPTETIRVWCAGCATGEEAYTVAIVLAEAVGLDSFRERVRVYATDVDEDALWRARQATYTPKEVAGVPPHLLDAYFDQVDGRHIFKKDLRRSVILGRHDLVQDAPISRVDLLVCRNVLMYFNAEAQSRILTRFHFALEESGYLFLGRAEMLFTHSHIFAPVDLRRRLFNPVAKVATRDRLLMMANHGDPASGPASQARLRDLAWDSAPLVQLVVDANGFLVLASERARNLLGVAPRDIGRPLQDLQVSYRPVELRSCIDQAYTEGRPVSVKEIEWSLPSGDRRWLDVQVAPLAEPTGTQLGALITFTDVTRYRRLQEELEHSHQELETAYEELQSTNEELETTNEELQSTVEELETTNEELQATNEELETMNEELQSTNEELETINDELRQRSDDLNQVNAFQDAILRSLRSAVVVVDPDMRVHVWNRRAEDLWGLRAEEVVDKNFLNLDIGLPVASLRPAIRTCLHDGAEPQDLVLDATNRRGRGIRCRVACSALTGHTGDRRGVILLMDELAEKKPS